MSNSTKKSTNTSGGCRHHQTPPPSGLTSAQLSKWEHEDAWGKYNAASKTIMREQPGTRQILNKRLAEKLGRPIQDHLCGSASVIIVGANKNAPRIGESVQTGHPVNDAVAYLTQAPCLGGTESMAIAGVDKNAPRVGESVQTGHPVNDSFAYSTQAHSQGENVETNSDSHDVVDLVDTGKNVETNSDVHDVVDLVDTGYCPICQGIASMGDYNVMLTPCCHNEFHQNCVAEYLAHKPNNTRCPLCNAIFDQATVICRMTYVKNPHNQPNEMNPNQCYQELVRLHKKNLKPKARKTQ